LHIRLLLLPGLVALLVACATAPTLPLAGGTQAFTVTLAGFTPAEQAARSQLQRLIDAYPVEELMYTREILIDEKQRIPHSHPVLTLNTRYLEDDDAQLATLVHEQFHWLEEQQPARFNAAMAMFRERWPDAPGPEGGGARDQESTWRHLVVCDLELQAMTRLVGEARAREVLRAWKHYPWVYQRVLEDPEVRRINAAAGMLLP
jgi:hypothetical protein